MVDKPKDDASQNICKERAAAGKSHVSLHSENAIFAES